MASDIWLRTILIVRKETCCRHIGYSYRLTARVLLYVPSHRQDNIHHSLCYTSCGALAGTRNSSMGPPHEGSIRRPIALPLNYVPLFFNEGRQCFYFYLTTHSTHVIYGYAVSIKCNMSIFRYHLVGWRPIGSLLHQQIHRSRFCVGFVRLSNVCLRHIGHTDSVASHDASGKHLVTRA